MQSLFSCEGSEMIRPASYAIIFAIVHLFGFTPPAYAQSDESARVVRISPDEGFGSINSYVSTYLETTEALSIDDALELSKSDQFTPINTRIADFGYYEKGIWLKVPIENTTSTSLEQLLILHVNFMREMDVYFVSDEGVAHLLQQDVDSAFKSRPIKYHQLVAPLEIEPQSAGEFYIRYESEGETVLPLSLETPLSFAQRTNRRVTIDFVFYGIMMMFVGASLVGRFFWRNPTFITYSLYASSVLLYIFQRDGYAFEYLWPNAPVWNNFSSLPIGASLPIFAAFFTRAYLNTNKLHKFIDKVLIAIVVMQLSVVASFVVIGASSAKQLAILTTMISIIGYFGIGVAAYRKYGRRTVFFVVGWLGILFASIIMTLVHWSGVDISRAQSLDVMRGAMVFDAFMLGLASLVSVVEIQRDREKLAHQQVDTLSANLEMHNRLGRLEQKYHLAQSLAERANQRVMDATHDLRQPLYALRASLGEMGRGEKVSKNPNEIEHSLTYMEGLVEAVLGEALEQGEVETPIEETGAEAMKVEKLFASLLTMFTNDAEKQGVELNAVPSSQTINVAPFPVLRILSNFVSNAIRYAPGARITIGTRRHGGRLSLEVHDTGPGMTDAELAEIKTRRHRGEAAKESDRGLGLGLSIVDELARENNFEWALKSRKGHGTIATLIVPIAEQ